MGGGTMSVAVGVGVASTVGMADGMAVGTTGVAEDVTTGEGEDEGSGVGVGWVGWHAAKASAAHNAAKMRAALQNLAGPALFNITSPIRKFNPPHPAALCT
jgi:hypothetical protein